MEICRNNATHGNCECMTGYYRATGSKQCEKDCENSFCLNKGNCQRGPNGRVCICAHGYSGDRCQNESKDNIVVIVVCVVAAVIIIAFIIAFYLYKRKKSYRLNKGIHLDNRSSPENSPGYAMKSYTNKLNVYGDEPGSRESTPASQRRSFTNKVAADSVAQDEADNDQGDSGEM